MTGTVVHTGEVVIDLTLTITDLPEPGGDVFADDADMAVGGGFNVLAAARRLDVPTVFAGSLGSGPFSDMARAELARIGVEHVGQNLPGDIGYSIAMTDQNAERTFVSTRGAETRTSPSAFDVLEPGSGDVVYVSGYSLAHPATTTTLVRLARRLRAQWPQSAARREGPTVLVDVSPVIGAAPMEALRALADLAPVWSVNEREAAILFRRLGLVAGDDLERVAIDLAGELGRVVVRAGALGSWYATADGDGDGDVVRTPTIDVEAIDTNGAGDAHSGVLAAALARGEDLRTALRWANVAGALSTTHRGPAACPSLEEILALA